MVGTREQGRCAESWGEEEFGGRMNGAHCGTIVREHEIMVLFVDLNSDMAYVVC